LATTPIRESRRTLPIDHIVILGERSKPICAETSVGFKPLPWAKHSTILRRMSVVATTAGVPGLQH
jgi:hypothetical protein